MKYVGARYTPKFMDTYDATQAYEALSVVDNGLGTSYICDKDTPAGTPLTDTNYWHVYGASSGAIINLQNQIDSIDNIIDAMKGNLEIFRNKSILILGDSTSDEAVESPNWVGLLKSACTSLNLGTTINNQAISGASLVGIMQSGIIDTITDSYDFIFIGLGLNDCTAQIPLGYPSSSNNTEFLGALNNLYSKILSKWFNAKVFYLIPNKTNLITTPERIIRLNTYRAAIQLFCAYWSWNIIDLTQAPWLSPVDAYVLSNNFQAGIHPSSSYAPILLDYILRKVNCGGDITIGKFYDELVYDVNDANFNGTIKFSISTDGEVMYNIYLTTSVSGVQTPITGVPDVYRGNFMLYNQDYENVGIGWSGTGDLYLKIPTGTTTISGNGKFHCPNLWLGVNYSL